MAASPSAAGGGICWQVKIKPSVPSALPSHYVLLRRNFKLINSISGEENTCRISLTWCSYRRERLRVFTAEWKTVHALWNSLLIFHCTGCCHEVGLLESVWLGIILQPLNGFAPPNPLLSELLFVVCFFSSQDLPVFTAHNLAQATEPHLTSFQARNW